jgi:hypothetical protein
MSLPDEIGDVRTLPGGEFVTACIDAVEQEARTILHREERYRSNGQATDPENIRRAALLSAGAAMLAQIKADGAKMQPDRKNYTVMNAVTGGKAAFLQVEGGAQ